MQLFGITQVSNTPPPSMAEMNGLGTGFITDTALGGGSAVSDAGTLPNFLQLQNTGSLLLEPGMQLRGQVLNTRGNNVTFQFGDSQLTATTELPLQEGQLVELAVTGQQQGKWSLQLVGSQLFTPMSTEDVTTTLLQLNLPPTSANVALAKVMVAMGLPLQGEQVQELVQNLAQLTREATPEDMTAAVFLKAGSLPLTGDNITLLADFITEHPFISVQLSSLQTSFRRLLDDPVQRGQMSETLIQALEEAPGILGEFVLDPYKQTNRKLQQRLHDMAFQAGIESLGPHAGDDIDMMLWLRSLREKIYGQKQMTGEMRAAAGNLSSLEETFGAMRLMNAAAGAEQSSFYFQLPMKGEGDAAEARLVYHVDSQGRPVMDEDNARLELLIPTENMGKVSWQIAIRWGRAVIDVSVDSEASRQAMLANLPVLVERLEVLGYEVVPPTVTSRAKVEQAVMPPIAAPEFDSLKRVNIQA